MPPAGASKGVDRLKSAVGCRVDCRFVVWFVAGNWDAQQGENAGISRLFSIPFFLRQRKQQEILKNVKSKNSRPDLCLQVFRGSLPNFVAAALPGLISFMEVNAYGRKEDAEPKEAD